MAEPVGTEGYIEYEILMNYGVWPSGTSADAAFVLGDMPPDPKATDDEKAKTAPWTITFPKVASSSVKGPEEEVEPAATL